MLKTENNINWSNDDWKDGKEGKQLFTYHAVPGSVHQLTAETVRFIKKLIMAQGNLQGVIYLNDEDNNPVNVFTCASNNLHNIQQNGAWQCYSNYTRATPGEICFVLPTKKAGKNMPGYQFTLADKE